jgi:CheY-like chemotaxis protein
MLEAAGCDCTFAYDGAQAVTAAGLTRYNLILMDMQMPVMDGLTATRAIRDLEAAEGRVRTPVVMLTANAMAEHVEAGRQAGADGHLTKPVTLASLFDAIGAALQGEGQAEAA